MQGLTLFLFAMLMVFLIPLLACDAQGTPQATISPEQAQEAATATGQTPGPTPTLADRAGPPTEAAAATATPAGSVETDKEALIALYNATDGPNWLVWEYQENNWLSEDPVGDWYGVTTDDDGRVTKLQLYGFGLNGEIPSELANLTNLMWLELGNSLLSGEIPPELGDLSNLEYLDLSGNDWEDSELTGAIPPELGRLSNLTKLYLRGNRLSGEIPPELGSLSSLQTLDLRANQLSGPIPPELGNLSSLGELTLANNQLSGEIPPELWNLTNASLSLSANQSGWCVPVDQLDRWTPHESVDLAGCGSPGLATATPPPAPTPATVEPRATPYPTLTPAADGDREALTALYNAADGDNWLCNENWLSDKPLSTWCFVETDDEGRVVFLTLGYNNLRGEIPSALGNLSRLQMLDLRENQLSGAIPPELGKLSSLEALDLRENQLSGVIPPELGNLSSLAFLYLNHNDLRTHLPPELGTLPNLQVLGIDGAWAISGCVPAVLKSQLDMKQSDLQDVPFCGDASRPTPTPVAGGTSAPRGTPEVELPWTLDGLTAIEREALGYLETIRQDDFVYEALVSGHPWLSSGIGEDERRFLCLVASIAEPATRYAAVLAEEPSASTPECGTPQQTVEGKVFASPSGGYAGDFISLYGLDLPVLSVIDSIAFSDGRLYEEIVAPSSIQTDEQGEFIASDVLVPDVPAGSYNIIISIDGRNYETIFKVF